MKKRLVYHLFYDKSFSNSFAYQLHFLCLSSFKNVFDEAIIVIALNDTNDVDTIKMLEHKIISMGFTGSIQFIIRQANELNEADTFYNEIINKLGKFYGWTFFAHSKGISNNECPPKDICLWITAMYYFGLHTMEDFEAQKRFHRLIGYGFPLVTDTEPEHHFTEYNKYGHMYAGTLFWINEPELHRYIQITKQEILPPSNRYYAEEFLGNTVKSIITTPFAPISSYRTIFFNTDVNFYCQSDTIVNTLRLLDPEALQGFLEFYNQMMGCLKKEELFIKE